MKRFISGAVLALFLATAAQAQDRPLVIELKGGKAAYRNVPVTVPLSLPPEWADRDNIIVKLPDGSTVGQLADPGLLTEAHKPNAPTLKRRDLTFVIPELPAGQPLTVKVDFVDAPAAGSFAWTDKPGEYTELAYTDKSGKARPVLRYIAHAYDDSSKDSRDRSYKVFHHLYDPAGTRFVTNGGFADADAASRKLLYPHHRGLMYGFMKCSYDGGKQADTWHCTRDAHVSHVKDLQREAGPVLGRQRVLLDWYGNKQDIFAKEQRELTVYHVPGGTLVEFASRLEPTGAEIRLDGDPQHAGFQFRASNLVAEKTAKQTYFLRPDGKGLLGDTRNWGPKNKGPVDLPWNAMSFVIDGQRYSVGYVNSPLNPKESRFSERDYGRFGCYFAVDVERERPLLVDYRIWLQEGEMTVELMQALFRQFAEPVVATVR